MPAARAMRRPRFFDPDVFRETGETIYLPVPSSEATEQRVMIGAGLAKSVADWRCTSREPRHCASRCELRIAPVRYHGPVHLRGELSGQRVSEIIDGLKAELPNPHRGMSVH